MMGYTPTSVWHELKVIDFLLNTGKISSEEACDLRHYLESLV